MKIQIMTEPTEAECFEAEQELMCKHRNIQCSIQNIGYIGVK